MANVLVTGGAGMIGRALVDLLIDKKHSVKVADLNPVDGIDSVICDLRDRSACLDVCKNIDWVFHLANVKSGVGVGHTQSAENFTSNSLINMNMLESARLCGVKRYLFTSAIATYAENSSYEESDMWNGFPESTDKYGGWCKRIGELQCEAYKNQFDMKISIVRPSSVYGPHDQFNSEGMVVGALISRVASAKEGDDLVVWGNGYAVRDFIYVNDVAKGMYLALDSCFTDHPINIGTGKGTSIRELAESICRIAGKKLHIVFDEAMPSGPKSKVLNMFWAKKYIGFITRYSLEEGLRETIEWYFKNGQ